jgi:REP element-mobilizing transposase RayT
MPNHFHLLVQPEQAEQLNKWMQWLMTSHVRRYHQHYGTSGHVWQGKEDWKKELCGKMGLESTVWPRGWQKGRKRGVNNQPVPL